MYFDLVGCGLKASFRSAFLFRNQKAKTSIKAFFRPLDSGVWICTLSSIVLLVVLLKVAFNIERILKNRKENSWIYLILTTIGTFCQQGVVEIEKHQYNLFCFIVLGSLQNSVMFSGRIVILFALILSMLIYQFYSASIVSFLLIKPSTSFKTLKDILHSGMKVGCEDILYMRDFLIVSQ